MSLLVCIALIAVGIVIGYCFGDLMRFIFMRMIKGGFKGFNEYKLDIHEEIDKMISTAKYKIEGSDKSITWILQITKPYDDNNLVIRELIK